MTLTGELHDKIAEQIGKARRSTREVKVPIYFSITTVLLWYTLKGLTKKRSNKAITPWHWERVIGVRPPIAQRRHQPERGGIQSPGQSCHFRGYHNYPWDWAQPQVTDSCWYFVML